MDLDAIIEAVAPDGYRYEVISRHLSKFATQQKIQRTDNFVRNMRPGTKFTGRIAEGWQLATRWMRPLRILRSFRSRCESWVATPKT